MNLNKEYKSHNIEKKWILLWEQSKIFIANNSFKNKLSYVLMMPPPNATGTLHNGHALFVTLEDILIRYNRMMGRNVLWLPGIDHAGIATQTTVEKYINIKYKKTIKSLGYSYFLENIWKWYHNKSLIIIKQIKLLGASTDWSRIIFTMDTNYSYAVKIAFIKLWNDNLIYRAERLIYWDFALATALSEEEVEYREEETNLYYYAYPLTNNSMKEIIIATTRPETTLGDTAIAVSPNDNRYKNLIGKLVKHPLQKRYLKIISDYYVDKNYGTGAVKITPAHDINDFDMAKRHNLKKINIFNKMGYLNYNCNHFQGLNIINAREKIIEEIKKKGLLRNIKKIKHKVMISQRSNKIIEPIVSKQYFIKMKNLASSAITNIETDQLKIIPSFWKKTWNYFLKNIKDWCISRQLIWGHKIPIYYNIYKLKKIIYSNLILKSHKSILTKLINKVSNEKLLKKSLEILSDNIIRKISIPSIEKLDIKKYIQENDVLDTWFSSALWPFASLGWPMITKDFIKYFPGSVLETGYDILFFWVSRMVMFGKYFLNKLPFKEIYLHAMIRDSRGRKMSKSFGNVIDPIDIINGVALKKMISNIYKYPIKNNKMQEIINDLKKEYPFGIPAITADGLRFSLSMLSGYNREIKLSIPRIIGYKAFLNKIWNAFRFTILKSENIRTYKIIKISNIYKFSLFDEWILSKLQKTIKLIHIFIKKYKFNNATNEIYHFFYSDFCNWYIEYSKFYLNEKDNTNKINIISILINIIKTSIKLLHPFCPFITEEIWNKLKNRFKHIFNNEPNFCAISTYPINNDLFLNTKSEDKVNIIINIISFIRSIKNKHKTDLIIETYNIQYFILLKEYNNFIRYISYINKITISNINNNKNIKSNARCYFKYGMKFIFLGNANNKNTKSIEENNKKLFNMNNRKTLLESRINNPNFINKANSAIILSTKKKLLEINKEIILIKSIIKTQ